MPPARPPNKLPLSKSREVVPVGPREVFKKHPGRQRDANGNKPLTARALVLRNGKYGAMGTGELMLASRMSGREKLDLLAEDLIKQAIAAPFKLEICLRIADSQLSAYLDEINALHDPERFSDRILAEAQAHTSETQRRQIKDPNKLRHLFVSMCASHIHNMYMMASGWRVVGDIIRDLAEDGLDDAAVKVLLRTNASMRSRFLVLYDTVNVLVSAGQKNFAILATTAPHFSQYFRQRQDPETGEIEYMFDWDHLKSVHKSFLDSIIVELCLPDSPIPKQILIQLLGEATEESPKDGQKFSQVLWDAVGDLSNIVELQSMLEGILYGPEGEKWKQESRQMPEAYEDWVDAQIFSKEASALWPRYVDDVYPLTKTREKQVLDRVWKKIDENYKGISGKGIDELWDVADVRHVKPSWHGFDKRSRQDDVLALVPGGRSNGGRKALAITDGDESDGSMPSLQTVSDSGDEESEYGDEDDYSDFEDEVSDGSEEEYDTDEEDDLRDLLREAMDAAIASGDFFDPKAPVPEFDSLAEERKGNPFLKLLGSLRGRMFPASPTVTTTTRSEPRRPFAGKGPSAPPASGAAQARPSATKPSTGAGPQKPLQTTVEEVEDEEGPTGAAKKKKKKKPKKKKPASAATTAEDANASPTPAPAPASTAQPTSPSPAAKTPQSPAKPTPGKGQQAKPKPPAKPAAQTQQQPRASFSSSTTTLHPFGSTTSLPLPQEQTAQSAHKYLQTEGLAGGKTKVKTRSAVGNLGNLDPVPEKKKRVYSVFKKKKDQDDDSDSEAGGQKGRSPWTGLKRKTAELVHQLFRTPQDKRQGIAEMRWEKFVKMMTDLEFTYDPATAGSSVRFDPPNPKDRSISFHKPHPSPTIHPKKLRDFSKKLQEYYGWDPEEFLKATQAAEYSD